MGGASPQLYKEDAHFIGTDLLNSADQSGFLDSTLYAPYSVKEFVDYWFNDRVFQFTIESLTSYTFATAFYSLSMIGRTSATAATHFDVYESRG